MTIVFSVITLGFMSDKVIQMIPADDAGFLSAMYNWGIEVIKVIQQIENPVLTTILKVITTLGTEAFYVPVILFILWWIDEKRGLRFGILIIVTAWINSFFKDLLKQPRPFNLEPSVGLAFEPTYGAPSGHAQMSMAFWVSMAAWLSQKWKEEKPERKRLFIWGGSVFMILLIAYTRLYLGVHFPTDIFSGWILAGIILAVYFIPGPRLQKLIARAGARYQNIGVAIIVLLMNGLYPKDRMLPAVLLGFCIGYSLMKIRFPFCARGMINGKKPGSFVMILRCLIGLAGVAVIYVGLKLVFPGEGSLFSGIPVWGESSPFYELGRFIRYTFIGLWSSAGAPWVFQRMGLASIVKNENASSS